MKRTKIVCTIGPASQKASLLTLMMKAGMNVARLNFSHGTHASHAKIVRSIRSTSKKLHMPIAIIGDLQGPKIRLGILPDAGVSLPTGSSIVFSTASTIFKSGTIPVTYTNLHKDVKVGHRIMIDDGILEAEVTRIDGKKIHAKMKNGGTVTSHKGMNFPDSTLKVSSLTEKDREDVKFGVAQGVDWFALSFVTSPDDVKLLRRLIKQASEKDQILPRILVKIEKHEAIENFDEILKVTDAVMVARGDLGVEIPAEEVPILQKEMIEKCREASKPVVVATQMLDSMIRNPRPTRAEVSDVANAVIDHADALMLSGETASGKYPVEAIKMMNKIIQETETSAYSALPNSVDTRTDETMEESISSVASILASEVSAKLVLVASISGNAGRTVSRFRPIVPIYVATNNSKTYHQLNLSWGVIPFIVPKCEMVEVLIKKSVQYMQKNKIVKKNDKIILVAGELVGTSGDVNLVEIKKIV